LKMYRKDAIQNVQNNKAQESEYAKVQKRLMEQFRLSF